jgi:hypothetical protein
MKWLLHQRIERAHEPIAQNLGYESGRACETLLAWHSRSTYELK